MTWDPDDFNRGAPLGFRDFCPSCGSRERGVRRLLRPFVPGGTKDTCTDTWHDVQDVHQRTLDLAEAALRASDPSDDPVKDAETVVRDGLERCERLDDQYLDCFADKRVKPRGYCDPCKARVALDSLVSHIGQLQGQLRGDLDRAVACTNAWHDVQDVHQRTLDLAEAASERSRLPDE